MRGFGLLLDRGGATSVEFNLLKERHTGRGRLEKPIVGFRQEAGWYEACPRRLRTCARVFQPAS